MKFDLCNKSWFSRLHSFWGDTLVTASTLDCNVFASGEIALKINDFKILYVEGEKISFLLINYGIFFPYFDPRV